MSEAEKINRALRIVAQIIQRDGPKYLPVFERLEAAQAAQNGSAAALARAAAMV